MIMKNKLSLDEVLDCLESLRSLTTYGFSSKDLNFALDEIIEIIENQKIYRSDVLHYQLIRCTSCNHYNLPEETFCHVCRKELNKER